MGTAINTTVGGTASMLVIAVDIIPQHIGCLRDRQWHGEQTEWMNGHQKVPIELQSHQSYGAR